MTDQKILPVVHTEDRNWENFCEAAPAIWSNVLAWMIRFNADLIQDNGPTPGLLQTPIPFHNVIHFHRGPIKPIVIQFVNRKF